LVISVAKYKYIRSTASDAKEIIKKYKSIIENDLSNLKIADVNKLKWLLIGNAKQVRAMEAYDRLSGQKYNDLKKEIARISVRTNRIININENVAWQDFAKKSVKYNGILEKIVPAIFGSNDVFYGLPENIAVQINDQCFFPKGLKCDFRAYQEWGVKYALHQKRVLLGDEMGLGKTVHGLRMEESRLQLMKQRDILI